MLMLWLKNNNVYQDLIVKEKAKQMNVSDDPEELGTFEKIQKRFKDVFWSIRLHLRFTVAPIVKISPSLFFRVLSYWVILSYLSDLYSGPGLLFPLSLFSMVAILNFLVGKYVLNIKEDEVLVNSVGGIVLPIYVDLHSVVRKNLYVQTCL